MLITLIVVLLIAGLALYAVQLLPVDGRLTLILQILVIIVAIIYLAKFL
jgi:hypothetical protein